MNCPNCGNPMVEGTLSVEGTILRFVFFAGLSWQSLWFKPRERKRGQKRQQLVIDAGLWESGRRCLECGTVVIDGR